MDPTRLRIHQFIPTSRANGPGLRAVLWVQGCTLSCPGCYNPNTHSRRGGKWMTVEQFFEQIATLQDTIEGVTISGGEPFQQPQALLKLLEQVHRETSLSILVFSGFTWEEIQHIPQAVPLLASIDVLIAGRYVASQRLARGLLGSANKTVHFLTPRYTLQDLQEIPPAEIMITPQGEVILSGIHPVKL